MPAQGALIRASDYTDVRKQISRLLGDKILEFGTDPERATYGYGQTVLSDSRTVVRTVDLVDDLDLATLRSDLLKVAAHCGVDSNPLITAIPVINQGDLVDNAHLEAYQAAIPLLNSNRFELGVGQYSDSVLITSTRSTPWGTTIYYGENTVRHNFTIDFVTAQKARYFFNSGGQIRFSGSRTGGTTTPQNTSWTDLLSTMGTVVFNHSSTSGASGVGSSIGFYDLTTLGQQVFIKTSGDAAYTANDYRILVSCNVADNTLGEARYVYVSIEFNDDSTANTSILVNDVVTGVLTSNVTVRRATGSNVQVDIPNVIPSVELSS